MPRTKKRSPGGKDCNSTNNHETNSTPKARNSDDRDGRNSGDAKGTYVPSTTKRARDRKINTLNNDKGSSQLKVRQTRSFKPSHGTFNAGIGGKKASKTLGPSKKEKKFKKKSTEPTPPRFSRREAWILSLVKDSSISVRLPLDENRDETPPWILSTKGRRIDLWTEMNDYARFCSLTEAEVRRRQSVIDNLTSVVHELWPASTVHVFGSFATGLCIPGSDIDVVITGVPEDLRKSEHGVPTKGDMATQWSAKNDDPTYRLPTQTKPGLSVQIGSDSDSDNVVFVENDDSKNLDEIDTMSLTGDDSDKGLTDGAENRARNRIMSDKAIKISKSTGKDIPDVFIDRVGDRKAERDAGRAGDKISDENLTGRTGDGSNGNFIVDCVGDVNHRDSRYNLQGNPGEGSVDRDGDTANKRTRFSPSRPSADGGDPPNSTELKKVRFNPQKRYFNGNQNNTTAGENENSKDAPKPILRRSHHNRINENTYKGKKPFDEGLKQYKVNPMYRLWKLAGSLKSKGDFAKDVSTIPNAKVPLVKFTAILQPPVASKALNTNDSPILDDTGDEDIACDVCFDCGTGVSALSFVKEKLEENPEARPIFLVVKTILSQIGLNDVADGGLGSFALFLMVISHLQQWNVNFKDIIPIEQKHERLLETFFQLYGLALPVDEIGLSVIQSGTYYQRKEEYPNSIIRNIENGCGLSIQDPIDHSNQLGTNCYRLRLIRNLFSNAASALSTWSPNSTHDVAFASTPLAALIRITKRMRDRRPSVLNNASK